MASADPPLRPSTKVVRGVILPWTFNNKNVEEAMDFVPDPGDVILATYPKCGTNWTVQILFLLNNKGVPPKSSEEYMSFSPFLELLGTGQLKTRSQPRYCTTHFDYSNVPKSPHAKYICVMRNPKDTLVSLYHFMQNEGFKFKGGSFDVVFDLFVRGETIYNDYFDHILSWYERRNDPNVLVLYYEKMKKQIRPSIVELAKFLGSSYEEVVKDEKCLEDIVLYSSFDYMKKTTNEFFRTAIAKHLQTIQKKATVPAPGSNDDDSSRFLVRKGVVGDWKNVLSAEQSEKIDILLEKRLKGTEMYDYWKSTGCI